jgi:protein-S-isoprenylcysteine O-methyltransferase Ste14
VQSPSIIKHLRDILVLPFTVTVIVPFFIHNNNRLLLRGNVVMYITSVFFFAMGLSLFLYTVYLFKSFGKGTLAPWSPTQNLVISGPYQYCRNPMITGVLFILIGESLWLHSINIAIWTAVFFIINTVYFILKEEPDLYKRFGEEYQTYKQHVPRWIPRFSPYKIKK